MHESAAFVNCTFVSCNFFDSRFTECKFVGSMFDGCQFDHMQVIDGDWAFVGLPGADLRRASFLRTRLREAALSPARQRAVLAFLELYESLRYGVQDASNKQNAHAQAILKQLKSLLKQSR